ncbi:hypothetical protein GCM10023107_49940 [Actinoplanes octamycinicus]|nr:hypothetical protein Aoc01nite_03450 [Actinoplanes octamycinicus]
MVVIGELVDNLLTSTTSKPMNSISHIQKALSEYLDGNEEWLLYLPQDYSLYRRNYSIDDTPHLPDNEAGGNIYRILRQPAGGVEFHRITWATFEEIIDGPARQWHASTYTMPRLLAEGADLLDAVRSKSVMPGHLKRTWVTLRCGRWLCREQHTIVADQLPEAACPRCGSSTFRAITTERAR